ncbi:DUF4168 domain-containing protein [Pseudanabaena sp. 'Roaring Creek']|uniref:DUF4168 domain-containing protein n=1 Tax=Pseudanabaena sp. 'Roaring Creek' TaxID=1681830 RepID=UPI0006D8282E|nr:DUF4168 domain-containing protein [Pseudanabaena sp. 'Roaring Creek']
MNSKPQRRLIDLSVDLRNYGKPQISLSYRLGQISLLGLFMVAIGVIAEPILGDRLFASAQTCVKPSSLQNFLTKVTIGDDHLTRYAAAANAIENKRLEIFRTAKSNPDWGNVANLAESQQTKVCDLANPPEFLRSLCAELRSYSEEAICRYGFTNKEFNQITIEQMQNPNLRSVIQDQQVQLRGNK